MNTQPPTPDPLTHAPTPMVRLLAAVMAWLVPGGGHWLLGQRVRARIFLTALLSLYLLGLLVGGISAIDHRPGPDAGGRQVSYWFIAQSGMGITPLLDRVLHGVLVNPRQDPPLPGGPHRYTPAFGRALDIGVLYTAVAGLLNMMVILDAGLGRHARVRGAVA